MARPHVAPLARLLAALLLALVTVGGPVATAACGDSSGPNCCRVCRTGKACGDSCIPVENTCNTPPGCACNG